MKSVCLLGGSGSIGESTLDVIRRHPEQFKLQSVSVHTNLSKLIDIVSEFRPTHAVISDWDTYQIAISDARITNSHCSLLFGQEGLVEIATDENTSHVMAAIVGAAGLKSSLAAVQAGKTILLANKESLVMSGQLFVDTATQNKATILPIDSEHNAIFQCLPSNYRYGNIESAGISKLLLTGSGGPFLNVELESLSAVTPQQACKHPNWSMGQKISVDSATMMNKGLEFIEACWLFGVRPEQIDVVIHPQSVIHSMVQYVDGSVLAQMGNPDMRTPIAHAMAYPERISAGVKPLEFSELPNFEFHKPDMRRFPNLQLAISAMSLGQYATTALNAANEVSVQGFLAGHHSFTDISKINEYVLNRISAVPCNELTAILAVDEQARRYADECMREIA